MLFDRKYIILVCIFIMVVAVIVTLLMLKDRKNVKSHLAQAKDAAAQAKDAAAQANMHEAIINTIAASPPNPSTTASATLHLEAAKAAASQAVAAASSVVNDPSTTTSDKSDAVAAAAAANRSLSNATKTVAAIASSPGSSSYVSYNINYTSEGSLPSPPSLSTANTAQCKALCDQTTGCDAVFTWGSTGGSCVLLDSSKFTTAPEAADPGCAFLWKGVGLPPNCTSALCSS
jgi:hypothetical protein